VERLVDDAIEQVRVVENTILVKVGYWNLLEESIVKRRADAPLQLVAKVCRLLYHAMGLLDGFRWQVVSRP